MYKVNYNQLTFDSFNQSCGMQLDPENVWVVLADSIPWRDFEVEYMKNFPSNTGHPAINVRIALGALIIKKRKKLSDRNLVKEVTENPYLQYFLGATRFQTTPIFKPSVLVDFRKRMDVEFISRVNELCIKNAGPISQHEDENESKRAKEAKVEDEHGNLGTQIIDATVSPSNIRYPQDFSLLNEAREKLEEMIDFFHEKYHPWDKPRTYRRVARKEYLKIAKAKKRPKNVMRKHLRRELNRVKRDIEYLDKYMHDGYAPNKKFVDTYLTILNLYEQQKYMYDNDTHTVENRIVSISQPYIRPVVRGKAKAPVEFGAKYDVSIDEKGYGRIERISFDPYNESAVLQDAIERYKKRTGHYPRRVLADQIYRTRSNISFCKEHHIELQGPKLGRPPKDKKESSKAEWQDNKDRGEVERFFSLDKGSNGGGLITTKLEDTSLSSIALSVLVTNLFLEPINSFFVLYFSLEKIGDQNGYFFEFDDVA